jgi:DNA modification methylase
MGYQILTGDCRETIQTLPDQSVQCVVTSPPYWGLRDYGVDGQLGLERTPDEYVTAMVEVFREVRRVLRDDGVLWLNLGDSYATSNPVGRRDGDSELRAGRAIPEGSFTTVSRTDPKGHGLKPKDLVGIPWRVAFALQADGWWLRQDVIWAKNNPMPEPVTDRCTRSHEYLFMLTKRERYFYDAEAIKEPLTEATLEDLARHGGPRGKQERNVGGRRDGFTAAKGTVGNPSGKNKRSVWVVNPRPYDGAHFAVMPPMLVEPCILAGSREGDTVLDPFGGSGTVGMVARWLKRDAVLCELNPEYVKLIEERVEMERTETGGARRVEPIVGGGASIDLLGELSGG